MLSTPYQFPNYGEWRLRDLQIELRRRQARYLGTKEQLIQRLKDYDRNNNFRPYNVETVTNDDGCYEVEWPSSGDFKSVSQSSDVPDLDIVHITQYFLDVYKDNCGMTEYQAVHRKGYNMVVNEFVCAMVETSKQNYVFYKAQVNSEYTKAMTYHVQIAFQKDRKIVQSECECTAGKGPKAVCKHVAATCYAVLKFKDTAVWCLRKTCTQKKQVWHAPKKTRLEVSPKKAEDLNLGVYEWNKLKRKRGKVLFNPMTSASSKEKFTSRVYMSTINFCHEKSAQLRITGSVPTVNMAAFITDNDYYDMPISHLQLLNLIKVTPEEANEIEAKTRKQAECKIWRSERSRRVTASSVGQICKFTERRDQKLFAEELVSPKPLHSPPVLWGKSKEPSAIECYEAFSHNIVKACGLFVSPEHPYIGASPDGLMGAHTILEVKCPYTIRQEKISPANYDHVEINNNVLCLKKTSSYYFQVQTQMFVTKRQQAEFFIWTLCDEKRIYVERDDDLINNVIIPRVKDFYYKYMLPALAKKYFPS